MARRVKFSIAQPITISGFLLASVLLIADVVALSTRPHYGIQDPNLLSNQRHALTQAFYYAIFAAVIYIIIGFLMCLTVYGAIRGHYSKQFHLTSSQRTLMLQTMSFITYLLLGALVYSHIEGWDFLDAVYWADVTLLTVGLGDYSPVTKVGRGLLFPFAIGGVLIIGLVIGSIRSLILERGKEKLSARIVEKRRSTAVHNVDDRKQTIKISMFASADFSTDSKLSASQKREEEFNVMRKVQSAAESERRYVALATSVSFTMILWFVGAFVFKESEVGEGWTYFEALYFSYTSLLTIGYGDFSPQSNSGKAFFVVWSLLAVPSLTILISNMGDTIIKWFSDLTVWIGAVTVLPGEGGFRASLRTAAQDIVKWIGDSFANFTGPGIFGDAPIKHDQRMGTTEYENKLLDRLAERLTTHVDKSESKQDLEADPAVDDEEKDIRFYHYVLARECRNVQKDLTASPPKKYEWGDWEYFLKLMGDEHDPEDFPGQQHPDIMVPAPLRAPLGMGTHEATGDHPDLEGSGKEMRTTDRTTNRNHDSDEKEASSSDDPLSDDVGHMDGNVDRQTSLMQHLDPRRKRRQNRRPKNPDAEPDYLVNWSWLSQESPLMSTKSEAEWILERLSAALERELNRQRKGYRRKPPISLKDARYTKSNGTSDARQTTDRGEACIKEQRELQKAAKGEE